MKRIKLVAQCQRYYVLKWYSSSLHRNMQIGSKFLLVEGGMGCKKLKQKSKKYSNLFNLKIIQITL